MRITGGTWRGRTLADIGKGDPAAHLRPSSDRTRETVFNILQNAAWLDGITLEGARVLDIFAGTGALGLEAQSRGAAFVTFIETGKPALALLNTNVKTLGAKADIAEFDACAPPKATQSYNMVFMDPPYNQRLGERAIAAFIKAGWLLDGAIVIWEEETLPKAINTLTLLDRRKIGRATVSFYKYRAN